MQTDHFASDDAAEQTALSAGKLANFLGISPQGLHWYEQQGIVKPDKLPNGYREYSIDDLCALSRVRFYHQCGFSTESMQELLASIPSDVRNLVQNRIHDIEKTLEFECAKLESLKRNAALLEKACEAPMFELSTLEPFWLKKIYDTKNGRIIPRRTSAKHWTDHIPLAQYYSVRIRDQHDASIDFVGVGIPKSNLKYASDEILDDIARGNASYIPRQRVLYAILAPKDTAFSPPSSAN